MAVTYFGLESGDFINYSAATGYFMACRFQNTAGNGNVTELGVNIRNDSSFNFHVGLYSDKAGPAPDALLVDSGEVAHPSGTGWADKTGLSVPVVLNDYYWIVLEVDAGAYIQSLAESGATPYEHDTYGALPDPAPALPHVDDFRLSLRAGVEAGGVSVPLTGVSG